MGCDVYANGDEIACKAGDNKVIAAMPDVCLSPPSPPAGPVPVPYPNTSFSKDMQNGSKTVLIKNKEAMLKDQSFYKTSPLGDEAATNSLGAGVINHVITGKTYCVAWSMDVKFEDQNVDRHTDLTTSNHSSPTADNPTPAPTIAGMAVDLLPQLKMCPCCKGPTHFDEFIFDPEDPIKGDLPGYSGNRSKPMTAAQWYNPDYSAYGTPRSAADQKAIDDAQKTMKEAEDKGCKDVLPSDDPDCSAHYVVRSSEPGRKEFDALSNPSTPDDWMIARYGPLRAKRLIRLRDRLRKAKRGGAKSIAHRTALAAGGCPVGPRNLHPVPPECAEVEGKLGDAQQKIADYHKRAHGWV
jgi:hypothetical protein